MKIKRADRALYELPELEETEFTFSTRGQFEDANDIGCIGDSISFAMDANSDFHAFDA
jgi:hypothetical protein